MKTRKGLIKYTEALIVLTIWLFVFAAPVLMFKGDDSIIWNNVFEAWMGVLPFFLLFMVNHLLLTPLLLFRNKKLTYLISVIVLLCIFSFSTFLIEGGGQLNPERGPFPGHQQPPPLQSQNIGPRPGNMIQQPPPHNPINFPPFLNTIIISILAIGFDTGLRMISRWSKLEQEKTFLEKENVQNQLAFLRNQVSPHFFMNTLNNIHALIDIDTEEAKESIIHLSKLMRHLLYDSEGEKIPIQKEIEFIKNYVDLMKLRYSEKVKITLELPEQIPDKTIPPLLFTSFVENAFKHGISYQDSSFIEIAFLCTNEQLIFKVKNSAPHNTKVNGNSGIGIENSRKRLDLIYGNKYDLKTEDGADDYSVQLSIRI